MGFALRLRRTVVFVAAVTALMPAMSHAQQLSKLNRERVRDMLRTISADVRRHYYDPKFHGVDWDAKVREADQKIERATSLNMAMSHLAAVLDALDDSHTFFVPPPRPYRHDYGFQYAAVGDRCYVTRVRPGSDAEAKGIRAGDEIVTINGLEVAPGDLWTIEYIYRILRPQLSLRVKLRQPSGNEVQVEVPAKMTALPQVMGLTSTDVWNFVRDMESENHRVRSREAEVNDVLILNLPNFDLSETRIDSLLGKMRKHRAVILDLRGNPGGYVEALKWMVGGLFDREIKMGDLVGREQHKPLVAKPHGGTFTGKLIVLVDSRSASAAELLARLLQIEKRGTVLGDRTSGKVMEAKAYSYQVGLDTVVFYGASITDADVIMTDGKSLEHAGVSPDELVLPSPADLASGRDPVLARAAQILGVELGAERAGKLFPYEWPSN